MTSAAKSIPYGAAPWRQTNWDARAAGNFIGGGTGAGLLVFTVLAGAAGTTRTVLLLLGLMLVGLGLTSVALEMGRPLRALNVFRHPGRSWMSREAIVATLLVIATFGAMVDVRGLDVASAILALAFVYCQARLLQAAKGIPAWHERRIVPLLMASGLVEGGGVFWLTALLHHLGGTRLLLGFAALVIVRSVVWHLYRRKLSAAPRAALTTATRVLGLAGTLAPLALIVLATFLPYAYAMYAIAMAGVLAWVAGAWAKLAIVTRAGFNRGFTLPTLPVRGARA